MRVSQSALGFPFHALCSLFFSLARLTKAMSHFPRQPFQARPGALLKGQLEMQLVQYKALRKTGTPHPVVSRSRRLPALLLGGPKTQQVPGLFLINEIVESPASGTGGGKKPIRQPVAVCLSSFRSTPTLRTAGSTAAASILTCHLSDP